MFGGTGERLNIMQTEQKDMALQIDLLESRCKDLEEKVNYLQDLLKTYEDVLINIRNNNAQISALQQSMDTVSFKINKISRISSALASDPNVKQENQEQPLSLSGQKSPKAPDSYSSIDYFDFENHFRGDRKTIMERQKQYLPYFKNCKRVVDIGCGRGEFLQLLSEAHIIATGVDTYDEFVEYCKELGLNAVCDDGNHYLYNIDHTDGIFVGQVVEHMTTEQIIELCNISWEKMDEGSYLIIETPNPTSLAIYTHAFYMDPSHVKPVHPLTMEYFLKKAGFKEVEIIYTECSKIDKTIPHLTGNGIDNLELFNEVMQTVSDTLFGSQDYAIIAKK